MMFDSDRRRVLQWMGLRLALPLLASAVPSQTSAAPAPRKRFIAVYFPNGSYMPKGVNGSWTFAEALSPLQAFRQNVIVVRGLRNGFKGIDPHWQNCTGFLSCAPIELGDPGVARCAKSLDQYVADEFPSPLRSLEIGGIYYHKHPLNDHPGYSHDYLNKISWQSADKPRSPVGDPARLFEQLFSGGDPAGAKRIKFLHARNQSILDQLHKDAARLGGRLPEGYRPVLESYMESVRELELQLSGPNVTCAEVPPKPTADFSQPNVNYEQRFRLMHSMIAMAMQCGLTNVASIMYGPSVSAQLSFPAELGKGANHHSCAHNGGTQAEIDRLKAMNRLQTGLLADLLKKLQDAKLLHETLVMYGSDMSDGNAHLTTNLPMLLCGEGTDLKFGQEVGSPEQARPLSDLHVDVASLLGLTSLTSFGANECLSTGQPLGLTA